MVLSPPRSPMSEVKPVSQPRRPVDAERASEPVKSPAPAAAPQTPPQAVGLRAPAPIAHHAGLSSADSPHHPELREAPALRPLATLQAVDPGPDWPPSQAEALRDQALELASEGVGGVEIFTRVMDTAIQGAQAQDGYTTQQ